MPPDFERLFEALPGAHMVIDRTFSYVAVNRAYEAVLNTPRSSMIGRNLFEVFPNDGESGELLRASFRRVFETGLPDTVAYIPYDIPRPAEQGGGMEQRFWTAVHQPLTDETGAVAYLIQNTTEVTEIVRLREAASLPFRSGATQLLERAREAEQQHRALLAESEEFRRLFQQAPGFFAIVSGPDHVFTFANDAYLRLIGGRNVIGMPVASALPEVVEQGFVTMLDSVYSSGKPEGGEAMLVRLQRKPDGAIEDMYLDFSYDAIRDSDGTVTGVFVQGMDRTEAVRTQQRQKLLLDELNHRVKNTLASVQSIASQTLRSARDLASGRADFESRIVALSKAHNLLSAREWASAPLGEIVNQELAIYDPAKVDAEGPDVTLSSKASIALALVIHELSTNAAKYGALSTPQGVVTVRWLTELEHGRLVIDWSERGGPLVQPPERQGFGSRMIRSVVVGELGGEFSSAYETEGFSCRVIVPCDAIVPTAERT